MATVLIIEDAKEAECTLIAVVRRALDALGATGSAWLAGGVCVVGERGGVRVGCDYSPPAGGRLDLARARQIASSDAPPDLARVPALPTYRLADRRVHETFVDGLVGQIPATSWAPSGSHEPTAVPDRSALIPLRSANSVFRLEGEYWTIAHAGTVLRLKDSKGLRYVAYLLNSPGQMLRALDVVAAVHQGAAPGSGGVGQTFDSSSGPVADRQAVSEYRRRLEDVRQEIDEAKEQNDLGRAAALQGEAEWLQRQLEEACGLGGRLRGLPSMSERARQTLTKGVRSTLKRIERGNAKLASYLARHIKTGYLCGYEPDPERLISWEL